MNKSYLINDICKFTSLKNIDFNKKRDIISVSLFKLKSGGYKSFSKYINGLKVLNNLAKNNDLEIRLFIDNTIYDDKEIMDSINKMETITSVLYECNTFKIGDHHVGLFGTIVRFFPLFDFENNDSRVVMILDADAEGLTELLDKQIKLYKMIKDDICNNIYLIYTGNYYNMSAENNFVEFKNEEILLPYCIASNIIGCKKITPKILYKFMETLEKYMDEKTRPTEILTNYLALIKKEEHDTKCENNICYGVDEYFINMGLLKYLLKHELPFAYQTIISYAHINYYRHPKGHFTQNTLEYKNKFYEYMEKFDLIKYPFKELDKQLYNLNVKKPTEFMMEYIDKISKVIKYTKQINDQIVFDKVDWFYLNLLEHYNCYYMEFIHFYNSDINNIIFKIIKN